MKQTPGATPIPTAPPGTVSISRFSNLPRCGLYSQHSKMKSRTGEFVCFMFA